jgi:hypothetical protein
MMNVDTVDHKTIPQRHLSRRRLVSRRFFGEDASTMALNDDTPRTLQYDEDEDDTIRNNKPTTKRRRIEQTKPLQQGKDEKIPLRIFTIN